MSELGDFLLDMCKSAWQLEAEFCLRRNQETNDRERKRLDERDASEPMPPQGTDPFLLNKIEGAEGGASGTEAEE